jgi:hypothetical protein
MRQLAIRLVALLITTSVTLAVLEVMLRFLPYNSGMPASHVDDSQPIFRYYPDRDISYSQDWDMKGARVRHVNNAGFISDIDYDPEGGGPLLAIVGDSYIEAMQVDWRDTVQARLTAPLADHGRVYAFGAAYAGLAQYLTWAKFAHDSYKPDVLAVNVVGNDFLQPLPKPGQPFPGGFLGMSYFDEGGDGQLVLRRSNRARDGLMASILRRSALFSYAYRNLNITAAPGQLSAMMHRLLAKPEAHRYIANTEARVDAGELALAKREVDLFLDLLPQAAGLPPQSIVISIDGIRPTLYDPAELARERDSFPAVMSAYLQAQARARGFEVVDLQPRFIAEHEKSGKVFEFPFNNHWNGNGHQVLAEAMSSSAAYAKVFGH